MHNTVSFLESQLFSMAGPKKPEEQRREELLRAAYRVAARDRLGGLTTRAVAQEAGVSNGLVFFHFTSREGLLLALLDLLLETTVLSPETPVHGDRHPRFILLERIERDIRSLRMSRDRVALLVDYWVMGTQHMEVRERIRAALARYRSSYLPITTAVVESTPERYSAISPEALAAVATGFVEGCAMQVVMDPERFNVDAYMATLHALVLYPALASVAVT